MNSPITSTLVSLGKETFTLSSYNMSTLIPSCSKNSMVESTASNVFYVSCDDVRHTFEPQNMEVFNSQKVPSLNHVKTQKKNPSPLGSYFGRDVCYANIDAPTFSSSFEDDNNIYMVERVSRPHNLFSEPGEGYVLLDRSLDKKDYEDEYVHFGEDPYTITAYPSSKHPQEYYVENFYAGESWILSCEERVTFFMLRGILLHTERLHNSTRIVSFEGDVVLEFEGELLSYASGNDFVVFHISPDRLLVLN